MEDDGEFSDDEFDEVEERKAAARKRRRTRSNKRKEAIESLEERLRDLLTRPSDGAKRMTVDEVRRLGALPPVDRPLPLVPGLPSSPLLPAYVARQLRPHQVEGVQFVWSHLKENLGCILADYMGLGKTLQMLSVAWSFIKYGHTLPDVELASEHHRPRILVLAPVITIHNWEPESRRFLTPEMCNDLNVSILASAAAGILPSTRISIVRKWWEEGGMLVMGYELLRILTQVNVEEVSESTEELRSMLLDPGPHLVVLDEGHRLRNHKSKIAQTCAEFDTLRRVILTGYPLQNHLSEYWTMVNFIRPNFFGSFNEFRSQFVVPVREGEARDSTQAQVRRAKELSFILQAVVQPFVLRRGVQFLRCALPPKYEIVVFCRLTQLQAALYKGFLRDRDNMSDGKNLNQGTRLLDAYQATIMIGNHPDLVYQALQEPDSVTGKTVAGSEGIARQELWAGHERRVRRTLASLMSVPEPQGAQTLCLKDWPLYCVELQRTADEVIGLQLDALGLAGPVVVGLVTGKAAEKAQLVDIGDVLIGFEPIDGAGPPPVLERVEMTGIDEPLRLSRDRIIEYFQRLLNSNGQLRMGQPVHPALDMGRVAGLLHQLSVQPVRVWFRRGPLSRMTRSGAPMANAVLKVADDGVSDSDVDDVRGMDVLRGRDLDPPTGRLKWATPLMQNHVTDIPEYSAKFCVLFELLRQFKEAHERCTIFSQSVRSLDLLERLLERKFGGQLNLVRIDGSTPQPKRIAAMKAFNDPTKAVDVIMVSTRAGGEGINLTGGTRVVLLDVCWNPCHDRQAMCRSYRFGQKKPVFVYRLVNDGTMERTVFNLQVAKELMARDVVDGDESQRVFTTGELRKFFDIESFKKVQKMPTKADLIASSGTTDSDGGTKTDYFDESCLKADPLLLSSLNHCLSLVTGCISQDSLLLEEDESIRLTEDAKKNALTMFAQERSKQSVAQVPVPQGADGAMVYGYGPNAPSQWVASSQAIGPMAMPPRPAGMRPMPGGLPMPVGHPPHLLHNGSTGSRPFTGYVGNATMVGKPATLGYPGSTPSMAPVPALKPVGFGSSPAASAAPPAATKLLPIPEFVELLDDDWASPMPMPAVKTPSGSKDARIPALGSQDMLWPSLGLPDDGFSYAADAHEPQDAQEAHPQAVPMLAAGSDVPAPVEEELGGALGSQDAAGQAEYWPASSVEVIDLADDY